jgi:hypothetical protein
MVALTPADGGSMVPPARPDASGSFTLPQVGPGRYILNAMTPGRGTYVKSATLGGRDVLDEGLDFTAGAAGTLEITVASGGGMITGAVKSDSGKTTGRRTAVLIPEPTSGGRRRTELYKSVPIAPAGNFLLTSVAPGKYRIYAFEDAEPGAWFDPEYMQLHENEGQPVNVEENSTQQITLGK